MCAWWGNRKGNEKSPYIFHFSPIVFFRCKKIRQQQKARRNRSGKIASTQCFFHMLSARSATNSELEEKRLGFFPTAATLFSISRASKRHKTIFFRFFLAVSVRENILLAVVCFYNFPAENRKVNTERRHRAQEKKLKTHWQRKSLKNSDKKFILC